MRKVNPYTLLLTLIVSIAAAQVPAETSDLLERMAQN